MNTRTSYTLIASLLVLAGISASVWAQHDYPGKPVRLVVPFPPAGGSDLMARITAQKLADIWGRPVIVDNRTGGNSILGTSIVANSPPDGYTLLLITSFHVTVPSLYKSLPYDTVRDFSGVGAIAKTRYVLIARGGFPANSVKELIALAKSKPGELTYGSAGVGGLVHLVGALFNNMVGTKMLHVPFKGAGPMIQDQMGGRVDISFPAAAVALPALGTGRVSALAVSGENRFPSLPQVPTFAEAGLPAFQVQGWFGLAVPGNTPRPLIDRISRDLAVAIESAEVKKLFAQVGMEPFTSSPARVDAMVRADIARYAKVIKEENIKPDD